MKVTKLSTGYWHVQFNQIHQFVQWMVGTFPTVEDTFGFLIEDREKAARAAAEAARKWESQ